MTLLILKRFNLPTAISHSLQCRLEITDNQPLTGRLTRFSVNSTPFHRPPGNLFKLSAWLSPLVRPSVRRSVVCLSACAPASLPALRQSSQSHSLVWGLSKSAYHLPLQQLHTRLLSCCTYMSLPVLDAWTASFFRPPVFLWPYMCGRVSVERRALMFLSDCARCGPRALLCSVNLSLVQCQFS